MIETAGRAAPARAVAIPHVPDEALTALGERHGEQVFVLGQFLGQLALEFVGVDAPAVRGDPPRDLKDDVAQRNGGHVRHGNSRSSHTEAASARALAACSMTSRVTVRPGGASSAS